MMKLIDKYKEYKFNNKDSIILLKSGIFYETYEDDAFLLKNNFNYQIKNGRVGFPIKSIENVMDKLNILNINYLIYEEDNIKIRKEFKNNQYYKEYNLLKKREYKEENKKLLLDRINFLIDDLDNYNKIRDFIDEF